MSSAGALALIIVTLILSLFTIVFGELVPKSLALAHTDAFALRLSGLIEILPARPRAARLRPHGDHERRSRMLGAGDQTQDVMTTEELSILVERGGEQGILEAEEEQMIQAVIELGDQRIHEVMVPRIAMVTLPVGRHRWRRRSTSSSSEGHSRIPVYEQTRSTRSSASSTPRTCCRS